jgi:GNAT superfamily N-acetyltransferase
LANVVVQTFSIAPAAASDCQDCARLLVEQLGEHGVAASTEQLSHVLERVVSDGARGFILLARDEHRIVGVAYVATILSAEHCGLVAWLEELYVTPSLRSLGIGTALLTAILKRAREMDIVAIDLEIDAGHSRAESLYRRFGFRRLDRSRWVRAAATADMGP